MQSLSNNTFPGAYAGSLFHIIMKVNWTRYSPIKGVFKRLEVIEPSCMTDKGTVLEKGVIQFIL